MDDDEMFTRQLRSEAYGPWPLIRELLLRDGVDPSLVRVHHIHDGGHGHGTEEGQLYEFRSPGARFAARIKWRFPRGEGNVNGWRREPAE